MKFKIEQVLGILCAVCASICWPILSSISKQIYLVTNITVLDMIYFRCLLPFLIMLPYVVIARVNLFDISKEVSFDMTIRSLIWVLFITFNFLSMKIMSLTKFIVLLFLAPMITSVLGYFMINEKLSIYDSIGCLSSFLGVVLIVTNPNTDKTNPIVANEPWWGFIAPIIAAFFLSTGDILQRKYSSKVNQITMQIWLYVAALFTVPFLSFAMHSQGDKNFPSFSLSGICYFILLGIVGVLAMSMYLLSLKYEKAGRAATVNYLQILVIMTIDTFYFKIRLTLRDIIGAGLILASNFTIAVLKAMEIIK